MSERIAWVRESDHGWQWRLTVNGVRTPYEVIACPDGWFPTGPKPGHVLPRFWKARLATREEAMAGALAAYRDTTSGGEGLTP